MNGHGWSTAGLAVLLTGALHVLAESYYIECETTEPRDKWIVTAELPGFTGSGYLANTGGGGDKSKPLVWEFAITAPGQYLIQFRCRRDMDYACPQTAESDQCNDYFTKVNDGPWEKTMAKRPQYGDDDGGSGYWGNWFWDGRITERKPADTRPIHDLGNGKNTLYVVARSPGVKLDAIAVFPLGSSRPTPTATDTHIPPPANRTAIGRKSPIVLSVSDMAGRRSGTKAYDLRGCAIPRRNGTGHAHGTRPRAEQAVVVVAAPEGGR
jgi:hypothetical protein